MEQASGSSLRAMGRGWGDRADALDGRRACARAPIVAVAHSILVIAHHVLRDRVSYRELGGDYFDHLNAQRLTRYHTPRLAALGYTVTLTKSAA